MTVHNTVLLDIWWNILIKFSKQIANTTKTNSKACETSEMQLFPQVVTGFRQIQNLTKHLRSDMSLQNEKSLRYETERSEVKNHSRSE